MSSADPTRQPRVSRRRLATLASVGGLAGGLWTVGLATISRSANPDLTIVGDGGWQVGLLEAGTNRILICAGIFGESAQEAIGRLLTSIRQHVDVVLATGSALQNMDRDGVLARAAVVHLDAPLDQPDTPLFRSLRQSMLINLENGELHLERLPRREWDNSTAEHAAWWIRLVLDGLQVVLAPDLEVAADVAPVESTLIVAPRGEVGSVLAALPGVAIATNGRGLSPYDGQQVTTATYLVRTFREDPARFRFEGSQLVLPEWAEAI